VCKKCLRQHDIFGRYGGEEFAILLPETPPEIALEVAERQREKIAGTRLSLDHAEVSVTASFGVAGIEKAGEIELDQLFKKADQALYQAKEAGRNRVRSWGFFLSSRRFRILTATLSSFSLKATSISPPPSR